MREEEKQEQEQHPYLLKCADACISDVPRFKLSSRKQNPGALSRSPF